MNNSWDNNIVKSFGEISKLMPPLPPSSIEVPQEKIVQEQQNPKLIESRTTWGSQRAKVAEAIAFSKKHPEMSTAEVARKFDIKVQTLYGARYKAKTKVKNKLAKAREVKASKVTSVSGTAWVQEAVMTSVKSLKDNVNHPAHYKTGGIETIDFIEAKGLTYNLGNVVKYITRADHKGNKLEDLEKAAWYLNREIQNLKK